MSRVKWIWQSPLPKHHAGPYLALLRSYCEIQRHPYFNHVQSNPAFCELLAYCFHCSKINIALISHFLKRNFFAISKFSKGLLILSSSTYHKCDGVCSPVCCIPESTSFFRAVPDRLKWYLGGSTIWRVALHWALASPLILLLANCKGWDNLLLFPVFWYIAASSVQLAFNMETYRFKTDWIKKQGSHPSQWAALNQNNTVDFRSELL